MGQRHERPLNIRCLLILKQLANLLVVFDGHMQVGGGHSYIAVAGRIANLVQGTDVSIDPSQGLDHGSWSVLRIMYPDADVPTLQLSLDVSKPGDFHLRLGNELDSTA